MRYTPYHEFYYLCFRSKLSLLCLHAQPKNMGACYLLFKSIPGRIEQLNECTAPIDASMIYESTSDLSLNLRDLANPRE